MWLTCWVSLCLISIRASFLLRTRSMHPFKTWIQMKFSFKNWRCFDIISVLVHLRLHLNRNYPCVIRRLGITLIIWLINTLMIVIWLLDHSIWNGHWWFLTIGNLSSHLSSLFRLALRSRVWKEWSVGLNGFI